MNPKTIAAQDKGPEEMVLFWEKSSMLKAAIEKMGEPEAEIFTRYFFGDQNLRQIAEMMQLNGSTVKTKFNRGKTKLKTILMEMGCGHRE